MLCVDVLSDIYYGDENPRLIVVNFDKIFNSSGNSYTVMLVYANDHWNEVDDIGSFYV